MKPIFAALAILVLAFPATSQGNNPPSHAAAPPAPAYTPAPAAPLSYIAQQAFDTCPALMLRTESAVATGHIQYYYAYDCECAARSIDYNTWNETTAAYDGPRMTDEDAFLIRNTLAGAATIEDAFSQIDSSLSPAGSSAMSACYGK